MASVQAFENNMKILTLPFFVFPLDKLNHLWCNTCTLPLCRWNSLGSLRVVKFHVLPRSQTVWLGVGANVINRSRSQDTSLIGVLKGCHDVRFVVIFKPSAEPIAFEDIFSRCARICMKMMPKILQIQLIPPVCIGRFRRRWHEFYRTLWRRPEANNLHLRGFTWHVKPSRRSTFHV